MKLKKILTGVLAAGLCTANLASIPASAYSGVSAGLDTVCHWRTPFAAHSYNYYGRNMMYMVQDAKNNNNQYIYVIKPR